MYLDHVTIRTNHLEETKTFFIKVFDLVEKERPKVIQRIPGHWLFKDEKPLVHLIQGYGFAEDNYNEAIDHVGIGLEGYHDFKKKLEELDIQYSLMDIEELEERRIFFRTPFGILLEGVFKEKIAV